MPDTNRKIMQHTIQRVQIWDVVTGFPGMLGALYI